jgi:flagellar protein FliO/FliZ
MDLMDAIRAIAALAITLGLLVGIALLARRYGLMQGVSPIGNKGRLKIIEQLWLDAGRTRAVILRCDGVDHLLVLAPTAINTIGTTRANVDNSPLDESLS